MDKLKIFHFDEGFWLYYHRLEGNRFKWPAMQEESVSVNIEELRWILKGIEEPTVEEITYKRAKKRNNIGKKDNLANLERKIIEHKL